MKVRLPDRGAEHLTVRAVGRRVISRLGEVSVDKIEVLVLGDPVKKRRPQIVNGIPSRVQTFSSVARESAHAIGENAQTTRIVLLRRRTQQLHSEAYPENRLLQRLYDFGKPTLAEMSHRARGFADS